MNQSITTRVDLLETYYSGSFTEFSKKLYTQDYPKQIKYTLRKKTKNKCPVYSLDFIEDENIFIKYIFTHYIEDGQIVKNIDIFYQKILALPINIKWEIIQIIDINYQKKIKRKREKFSFYEKELLNIILKTIYVENGHPSEFWFAILINGKVCGALNNGNIESDVIRENNTFSLKCYKDINNVSLGCLSIEFCDFLKRFITLSEIFTKIHINKNFSRKKFNEIFSEIDTINLKAEISAIKAESKFFILDRIIDYIQETCNDCIISTFQEKYNNLLQHKIYTVSWWIIIVNNDILIIDSNHMIKKLAMTSKKLEDAVLRFKDYQFFVNAGKLL